MFESVCLSRPVGSFRHAPDSPTLVHGGPSDGQRAFAAVLLTPSPSIAPGSQRPHPWTKTLCHWHDPRNHGNREAGTIQKTQRHVVGGSKQEQCQWLQLTTNATKRFMKNLRESKGHQNKVLFVFHILGNKECLKIWFYLSCCKSEKLNVASQISVIPKNSCNLACNYKNSSLSWLKKLYLVVWCKVHWIYTMRWTDHL